MKFFLIISACLFVACQPDAAPPGTAPESPAETAPIAAPETGPTHNAHDSCAPLAELDKMDPRKPVPLQPMMAWHQKQNMQEHLVAIQRITDGLSREDWDEVLEGARLIESSPQMQSMCQHMGMGAPGFTELALEFHKRADDIVVAAKAKNTADALKATSQTLQSCTGCHATYKQEVVDAATWQARTGSDHIPSGGHH